MAKSRKKKDHLPKRIAGMKVPKSIRRGRVGKFLASPEGEALVLGLVATAGQRIIRKGQVGRRTANFLRHPIESLKVAGGKTGHAGAEAAGDVKDFGAAFAYALGEAARSFSEALHTRPDEPDTTDNPKAAFPGEASESKGSKRKRGVDEDLIAH